MATWIREIPYSSQSAGTWDGYTLGTNTITWDDAFDSWDGKTITQWTNETKNN